MSNHNEKRLSKLRTCKLRPCPFDLKVRQKELWFFKRWRLNKLLFYSPQKWSKRREHKAKHACFPLKAGIFCSPKVLSQTQVSSARMVTCVQGTSLTILNCYLRVEAHLSLKLQSVAVCSCLCLLSPFLTLCLTCCINPCLLCCYITLQQLRACQNKS